MVLGSTRTETLTKTDGRSIYERIALLPDEALSRVLAEVRRVLRPQLMGGCRGIALLPHLERACFADVQRDFVTQLGFPSEIIRAVRPME